MISVLSFLLFILIMKRTAIKMTSQVVSFFETMEDILAVNTKNHKVDLTYKASCEELNELQLAFNDFVKTINITNEVVKEGEEYRALLDYADAYHIFKDFKNERQMGICLQNMAAIRFSLNEFSVAYTRFDMSASFLEEEILQI